MNKELYVTSTPHETKVGIVEDDQLAEIYLELENEYTLAGSIYKGRVTRVLPGMQSAFVDVGLERDAFLYVHDFMDLEQQDEDLDEAIPAGRPVGEGRPQRGSEQALPVTEGRALGFGHGQSEAVEAGTRDISLEGSSGTDGAREPRGFRGRRRRRGRSGERMERGGDRGERGNERAERDRNMNVTESRPQRPPLPEVRSGRDYDYGPPPGYQPMILPGESISKYRRQSQGAASPPEAPVRERQLPASIAGNFPDDEPMFAVAEPLHEQHEHVVPAEVYEEPREVVSSVASEVSEPQRETAPAASPALREEIAHEEDFRAVVQIPVGIIEEQEIEEEEVDLDAYEEELEEDAPYEELEEETRAAGESIPSPDAQESTAELVAETLSQPALETANRIRKRLWRKRSRRKSSNSKRRRKKPRHCWKRRPLARERWTPAPKCAVLLRKRGCSGGPVRRQHLTGTVVVAGGAVSGVARTRWCRRSANCSRKGRKSWCRLPRNRLARRARASPATSPCQDVFWCTCRR